MGGKTLPAAARSRHPGGVPVLGPLLAGKAGCFTGKGTLKRAQRALRGPRGVRAEGASESTCDGAGKGHGGLHRAAPGSERCPPAVSRSRGRTCEGTVPARSPGHPGLPRRVPRGRGAFPPFPPGPGPTPPAPFPSPALTGRSRSAAAAAAGRLR